MKMVWDVIGEREYETGVDRGVLYTMSNNAYNKGVAWSGLSKVTESPSGGEATAVYADNIKYLDMMSRETFGGTIEAYMYPDEWAVCDGSAEPAGGVFLEQQNRKAFGFSYRTLVGNDTEDTDYGYKIHLVYNSKAKPSSKDRSTVNESPEATTLSWEFSSTPVVVTAINPSTGKPFNATSHLVIKSTKANAEKLKALEDILYGTDETDPRLPLPDEVLELFAEAPNPLSALELDVDISASTDLLGKTVDDLQENIVVGDSAITGTLKYVTGYTGWSSNPAEQEGNYLAIHASVPEVDGVTITATLTQENLVDPADGLIVLRVTNKNIPLVLTAKKEGYADVVKNFSLTGLTLNNV